MKKHGPLARSFIVHEFNVKSGSPSREYNMLIDSGSDISRIVELNFYDTNNSSTPSVIFCSSPMCECSKANQCALT
ncbi:hypothetical protein H5410_027408 [Solanum commersonii]|uniref:Uncharacterized protein n=1 Tax=Solanum commersonii TaxID=4109 RepID=A0A9J5Z3A3_SOLCO|nr:hypothetical protein H5410_027408 [Solanum commersonii]